METFDDFINTIDNLENREKTARVFSWIDTEFPELNHRIAWNQPMYTHHDTFIIGFSVAKGHLAVTPEQAVIALFSDEIVKSGYAHSKMIFKIPWDKPVDFGLMKKLIQYNIKDKVDCKTFWRK